LDEWATGRIPLASSRRPRRDDHNKSHPSPGHSSPCSSSSHVCGLIPSQPKPGCFL